MLPRFKASSERDFLHKKNTMESHVLTKHHTILVKKERVMIKYGKEAFYILVSPNEAGLWAQEGAEEMGHRENTSGKFQTV